MSTATDRSTQVSPENSSLGLTLRTSLVLIERVLAMDRSGNLTRVCSKRNSRNETGSIYYRSNSSLNSILIFYEDCYSELGSFAR